jgi:hypothetical protein
MRLPRPAGATPLAIAGPAHAQGASLVPDERRRRLARHPREHLAHLGDAVVSVAGGFGLNWYLAKYHLQLHLGRPDAGLAEREHVADHHRRRTDAPSDVNMLSLEQRRQAWLLKQEGLYAQVPPGPNSDIRKTQWWASFGGSWKRRQGRPARQLQG